MGKENIQFIVADATHIDAAKKVSDWVSSNDAMLPKSPEQVLENFSTGHAVIGYDGTALVVHAALTQVNSDQTAEVGSLFTEETHRHMGLAREAVHVLLEHGRNLYPDHTLYAIANERSAPLFQKMGAREMQTDELGDEVWASCDTCPRKPERVEGCPFKCCDTPFDLTHVKSE
ncbi:MAG: GNAT family N-acetyltransferase [Patescibacteria group bacterium]